MSAPTLSPQAQGEGKRRGSLLFAHFGLTGPVALDVSREALERGAANAALNGAANIEWREGDAFETLRAFARAHERFDNIVLDPPAFAKSRASVPGALRGYHEINLRAMRCLAPGGSLLTASCSFHVGLPAFLAMLADAAADSGRTIVLRQVLGQAEDHPLVRRGRRGTVVSSR